MRIWLPSHSLSICLGFFVLLLGSPGEMGALLRAQPTTYTVGGTLSGLPAGASIVLQLNGGVTQTVTANGSFLFSRGDLPPSATTYAVTIFSQPTSWMTCMVSNGSGIIAGSDVSGVSVTCPTGIGGTYTVNGTVSGLSAGTTLNLLNCGDYVSTLNSNGTFSFTMPLASGPTYSVTVGSQSSGENCAVAGGSGVVNSADIVSGVSVTCTAGSVGSSTPSSTRPGAREGAASWIDSFGNLWMYGGFGYGSASARGLLNDLWEYSPNAVAGAPGTWTWAGGSSSTTNALAQYGSMGTPSANNWPTARQNANSWTDSSGNLWLFGGLGYDSTGASGVALSDLWEYTPNAGTWTWVGGSNLGNAAGIYGANPPSVGTPGGRSSAVSWGDPFGNIWMYGGLGSSTSRVLSFPMLSDLWKYTPSAVTGSAGTWTWVSGSKLANTPPPRVARGHSIIAPPGRYSATSWSDSLGNFWLFGGFGYAGGSLTGIFNDLWSYNPGALTNSVPAWTYHGGSFVAGGKGIYGTSAPSNGQPGPRDGAMSWNDSAGNPWLFGGFGNDSKGSFGFLNDLWEYNSNSNTWTWIGGSSVSNAAGTYGTQNSPATGNVPGARSSAVSWNDTLGNFWLFGGQGIDSNGTLGELSDLWEYIPSSTAGTAGSWTWIGGPSVANQFGIYGKATVPIMTPFIPAAFASVAPVQAFQEIATTGAYPNETLWAPDGLTLWVVSLGGAAAAYGPMSGNALASGGIVLGPDGAIWFPVSLKSGVSGTAYQIARIASNVETDYAFSNTARPTAIAVGPDKNLWVTTSGTLASIGQVQTSGSIGQPSFYTVQTTTQSAYGPVTMTLGPITSGPNSALWFIETVTTPAANLAPIYSYNLGEITTTGQVTSFSLPSNFTPSIVNAGMTAGSDGNLWIAGTENANTPSAMYGILQVMPPPPSITSGVESVFYRVPNNDYVVSSVAAGPDGALWGTLEPNPPAPPALLRMTTSGATSYVPLPPQPGYFAQPTASCTLSWDSGGILWFDSCGSLFLWRYQQ